MADKRAFAVLDVGYFENPKMIDVLDASSIALSMHIASVLYCSQHLTDGLISTKAIRRKIGGTDADVQILIDADLWHLPGHGCDSCPPVPENKAYVHDYLEHNRSSEGSKRTSKKAKAAAEARWAKEKSTQTTDAPSNAGSNAPSSASSNAPSIENGMLDAMHRQTDRQTVKDLSDSSESYDSKPRAVPDEFDKFWEIYPRKDAKGQARAKFKAALKKTSLSEILNGALRYRDDSNREAGFTKLPATWLNGECWLDGPIPAKESGLTRRDDSWMTR